MPREPIPTWYFAVVVVRKEDRYLLVHEAKHGELWYLPAGRVEPGESLVAAAQRETLEEAGIPICVEGVIRIEHSPRSGSTRLRVIFLGSPADDTPPKKTPDEESLGAAWVSLAELDKYPLRGDDVREVIEYLEGGGAVYPVSLIRREGAPFTAGE